MIRTPSTVTGLGKVYNLLINSWTVCVLYYTFYVSYACHFMLFWREIWFLSFYFSLTEYASNSNYKYKNVFRSIHYICDKNSFHILILWWAWHTLQLLHFANFAHFTPMQCHVLIFRGHLSLSMWTWMK